MQKKRKRRSKEEARRVILDAAEEVVLEQGPDAFSVTEVAERAGMHQTNVFHHFGTREALLDELIKREMQAGSKRALQALGEALGARAEDRDEAFARIFDVTQTKGIGRLYGWMLLSGRIGDDALPDLAPIMRAARAWRATMDEPEATSQDDLNMMVYTWLLVWLGESIGGDLFAKALGFADPERARGDFHLWLARMANGSRDTPETE